MNLGKAFTYPFEDPDYLKKLGIAALMALIPIFGSMVLIGWQVEITRRVFRRQTPVLPEWTDFGALFMQGLKAFVVLLVYLLPIILINACVQVSMIPLQSQSNNTFVMISSVVGIVGGCLSFILGIATALLLPPALGIFADTGQIGAALKFNDVIALLRANTSAYLLAFVGSLITGILVPLGIILCCVGLFITLALASAINGHLHGQAYALAKGMGPVN